MAMRSMFLFLSVLAALCSCTAVKNDDRLVNADTVANIIGPATVSPTEQQVLPGPALATTDDRFSITGDFDGNGGVDTIYESLVSQLTNREMPKELDADDWDRNTKLIFDQKPMARLYSSMVGVDTLMVADDPQQAGVCFFYNLGDLDGKPGDEFGYSVKWTDNSNLNTYLIITVKDHRFKELLSFRINEMVSWDEESLFDNGLFIKSISPGQIAYKFYSDSATVEEAIYTFPR